MALQTSTEAVEATTGRAVPTTAEDIGGALNGLEDLVNDQTTTAAVEITNGAVTTHQATQAAATTAVPMPIQSTAIPQSTAINQETSASNVNQPTTAPLVNNPTTKGAVATTDLDEVTDVATDAVTDAVTDVVTDVVTDAVTDAVTDVVTTASTSKSVTITGSLTTAYTWDDDLNDSTSALFKQYAATLESELAIIIKSSQYVYRFRVKYPFTVTNSIGKIITSAIHDPELIGQRSVNPWSRPLGASSQLIFTL